MANTKIDALPLYSGSAADLRWFVMNNSGETETFKYSGYTSPYKTAAGTNNSNNIYDTNVISGSHSAIVGGINSSVISSNYSAIVGGENNTINGTAQTTIIGGANNTIGSGYGRLINNGVQNVISGLGRYVDIHGGYGHTISASGFFLGIFNGIDNTLSTSSSAYNFHSIYYSQSSTISATGAYNNILGSDTSTIIGSSSYSQVIGGYGNTISSKTNVVMLGTSGRTANANDTTFVENLHTFRTPSTQVQPISSGTTFTCNLNNGAKAQFYITGTSTINITNVRDGASFMIKTQTDGNYVMTWTATGGYTFVFEGGLKDPGNTTTDIFVFEVFGSVIYGNRRHNYS